MKTVGIVICNFNKCEDTVACIKSVFAQDFNDFDLIVVDNASTDGSQETLKQLYEKDITLIESSSNTGGAGGFLQGMKLAVDRGYRFLMMLDCDVILDTKALGLMKEFLECHGEAGAVGSIIMKMDLPEIIQEYGTYIDFSGARLKLGYAWETELGNLPEEVECDCVPACAMLARTKDIADAGMMPEDNFIYWDDVELSYRMKLNGKRVFALKAAKAWHRGSFNQETAFFRYYFIRNKINFFMKYGKPGQEEKTAEAIIKDLSSRVYGDFWKSQEQLTKAAIYGMTDGIYGVRGKADSKKLSGEVKANTIYDRIISFQKAELYWSEDFGAEAGKAKYAAMYKIIKQLYSRCPDINITVICNEQNIKAELKNYLRIYGFLNIKTAESFSGDAVRICIWKHVRMAAMVKEPDLSAAHLDEWGNSITSKADAEYFSCYSRHEELFLSCWKPVLTDVLKKEI